MYMNIDSCEGKIHVVKEGDTLYKISRAYQVPLAMLLRANPYTDVYNLQIGSEICIPVMTERPSPTPTPNNSAVMPAQPPSNSAVMPAQPPSNSAVMPAQPPNNSAVMPAQPPSNSAVMPAQPPNNSAVMPAQPPSKSAVMPTQPPNKSAVMPAQPPNRSAVMPAQPPSKSMVMPTPTPSPSMVMPTPTPSPSMVMPTPTPAPIPMPMPKAGKVITMPDSDYLDMMDNVILYVVREGDTLGTLLERFDMNLNDLLNFNNLSEIALKAGSTVRLPETNDM